MVVGQRRVHHGRHAVHVRGGDVLGLRLKASTFEMLDGRQRHGGGAGRRAAMIGRGQLLSARRAVVLLLAMLWLLLLLLLLVLVMLRMGEGALHCRRRGTQRLFVWLGPGRAM